MVENGIADTDDMLKERIAGLRLGSRAYAGRARSCPRPNCVDAFQSEIVEQFGLLV